MANNGSEHPRAVPRTRDEDGMGSDPDLRLVRSRGPDRPDADTLLPRVARGDAQAFAALYDVMGASVYGVARRVVRDPNRAEDVSQEVFLEVWRKAPSFDEGRGSAKTWIMTIAHRRAVDAVRRNESLKKYDGVRVNAEITHDEPDDVLIRDEEHSDVRGCLDTLTE